MGGAWPRARPGDAVEDKNQAGGRSSEPAAGEGRATQKLSSKYVTELELQSEKQERDTKAGRGSLFALVSSKGFSEEMSFELNTK